MNELALNANLLGVNHLISHVKLLKESTMAVVSKFNSSSRAEQLAMLEEEPDRVLEGLVNVIETVAQDRELMRYMMATLDGLIREAPKYLGVLTRLRAPSGKTTWQLLKSFMSLSHEPATHEACFHLLCLIAGDSPPSADVASFLSLVLNGLYPQVSGFVLLCSLAQLVKHEHYARQFVREGGPLLLRGIMLDPKHCDDTETVYYALLLLWELSFEAFGVEALEDCRSSLVRLAAQATAHHQAAKVTRVAVQLFDNLKQNGGCLEQMNDAQLLAVLDRLLHKGIKSKSLEAAVATLAEFLELHLVPQNSGVRLVREVRSGVLEWGGVHTEKVLRENVAKLEANEFELVRALIACLGSNNPTVAAVACHDLGLFGKIYPFGPKMLETLGGKNQLMLLAKNSPEAAVREKAIEALQLVLSQKWAMI